MQRLQTRPQFQAVLAGAIVAKTEHFVLHRNGLDSRAPVKVPETVVVAGSKKAMSDKTGVDLESTPGSSASAQSALFPVQDAWMGAMVPKRWARRAVTRNAIKRQIYSVSAGFAGQFPQAAFVVRLRREFSRKLFVSAVSEPLKEAVRAEVLLLLQVLCTGARPA